MQARYLSAAETAKLVRQALKTAFAGVKFSVRSDTYAGGASIRVRWTDGPTVALVEAVAKGYAGGRFDGMIDMKISVSHWLMPDGSVSIASNPGTAGSMGVIAAEREWMPDPEAKLVRFGADFVFCDRDYSERFIGQACARLTRKGHRQFACAEVRTMSYSGSAWIADDRRQVEGWDIDMSTMLHRECVRLMIAAGAA